MNTVVQNQLDRLESILNTLVESIASYNPSIPAATDLITADDDLSKGVTERSLSSLPLERLSQTNSGAVAIHQTNHVRILQLREVIDALNHTISSNLTLLANTRKDLLATPATKFPEFQRSIPYDELLDYAKRISRYTVPPTFRSPPQRIPSTNGKPEKQAAQSPPSILPNDNEMQSGGIGVASLNQEDIQWLDPLNQIPFVPWPSEEVIRQGALAKIQLMLDQKIDPSCPSSSEDKPTQEQTKIEARPTETLSHEVRRESIKKNAENGIIKAEKREEKPKVFGGLDLYDPDEE